MLENEKLQRALQKKIGSRPRLRAEHEADRLYSDLIRFGSCVTTSGYLRLLLYHRLVSENRQFRSDKIRVHNARRFRDLHASNKFFLRNLLLGKILVEDVKEIAPNINIELLFDESVPFGVKNVEIEFYMHVLDHCNVYTFEKRIVLLD